MKRIALVGTAPSGVHAPFKDESWEIWGVGKRGEYVTRATRWFELHRLDGEKAGWADEWRRLMRSWSDECEIWMFYPEPDLGPKIIAMDPKPLIAKYGTFFMTSSFSWMMAQAIEEGANEIGLWGVDMEYGTEYRQQRVGLRHFIEVAKIKGIKVTRVVSSGIALEPVPYPFWMDDPLLAKISLRNDVLRSNRNSALRESEKFKESIVKLRGALEEIDRQKESKPRLAKWLNERAAKIRRDIESICDAERLAINDAKMLDGSLEELRWLEDYLRP